MQMREDQMKTKPLAPPPVALISSSKEEVNCFPSWVLIELYLLQMQSHSLLLLQGSHTDFSCVLQGKDVATHWSRSSGCLLQHV